MNETLASSKTQKVAIVGHSNTGKSHIFSRLTGNYSMSGNYSFTTIEMKSARMRLGAAEAEVLDTPGLQCLHFHSEEEIAVCDMLFSGEVDVIVQCVDANRLKQSLYLTLDLIELGIPMVIALNAVDETARNGIWIDAQELSRRLGVPVVETVAIQGRGIEELKAAIGRARSGGKPLRYGELAERGIAAIEESFPADACFRRKLALMLFQKDPYMPEKLREWWGAERTEAAIQAAEAVRSRYEGHFSRHMSQTRHRMIDETVAPVVRRSTVSLKGSSEFFARVCRDPLWGLPVLLGVVGVMFWAVVYVANPLAGWLDAFLWQPVEGFITGTTPSGFVHDFLVGDYGVLTLGLSTALLTVVPILSIFFLIFNILEDTGYIPNLCVLTKRAAERVGLTGNSILPITLAFGCKTMATLTTQNLRSRKERIIAVYLIAFGIPCAAQMALNMSILGRIGLWAVVVVFGFLSVIWVLSGVFLNRVLKDDQKCDFIQELPRMRMPNMQAVLTKTGYKLWSFIQEAVPIFLAAAVILFAADKTGALHLLKHVMSPIVEGFLGFPPKMVDILVLSMANRDAAAGMLIRVVSQNELTTIQTLVAVALTMMFVPCLANMVAMFRRLGASVALPMIIVINITAILWAGLFNATLNMGTVPRQESQVAASPTAGTVPGGKGRGLSPLQPR
ncbi:MAG: ferrous iron transport protein B [Candidatus Omnitrophica bacterium]|nr:ferrous iron transport protein B [Candidatus Omnitrophota bacterium]